MKVTETLAYALRASVYTISRLSYLGVRTVTTLVEGALCSAFFLVTYWLMTAVPETTTFTDFLWLIQSPRLAAIAAVGGLTLLLIRIVRSR